MQGKIIIKRLQRYGLTAMLGLALAVYSLYLGLTLPHGLFNYALPFAIMLIILIASMSVMLLIKERHVLSNNIKILLKYILQLLLYETIFILALSIIVIDLTTHNNNFVPNIRQLDLSAIALLLEYKYWPIYFASMQLVLLFWAVFIYEQYQSGCKKAFIGHFVCGNNAHTVSMFIKNLVNTIYYAAKIFAIIFLILYAISNLFALKQYFTNAIVLLSGILIAAFIFNHKMTFRHVAWMYNKKIGVGIVLMLYSMILVGIFSLLFIMFSQYADIVFKKTGIAYQQYFDSITLAEVKFRLPALLLIFTILWVPEFSCIMIKKAKRLALSQVALAYIINGIILYFIIDAIGIKVIKNNYQFIHLYYQIILAFSVLIILFIMLCYARSVGISQILYGVLPLPSNFKDQIRLKGAASIINVLPLYFAFYLFSGWLFFQIVAFGLSLYFLLLSMILAIIFLIRIR